MSPSPPRIPSAIFRRLLLGPLGDDARAELDEGYRQRRDAAGAAPAWLWYVGHLLHPDTWRLALALRRGRIRREPTSRGGSGFSWLDVRLGLRMLVKHPGLTLAGGMGMTAAIGLGAGFFDLSGDLFDPTLPLDEGERVVGIQNRDVAAGRVERRSLHDFRRWRRELASVETLGAYRTIERNLITVDGPPEPIVVAQITASGLGLARVPPLHGRLLLDDDERVGSPPVVVIGYELWERRFGGDPDVVGSSVRMGAGVRTVVGIMPPGFRFPVSHAAWIPLLDEDDYAALEGPAVFVFGRLRPGISRERAQVEAEGLRQRVASDSPEPYARLRVQVVPYTDQFTDLDGSAAGLLQLLFTAVVLLPCANVAILVYARTVGRQEEMSVRSALGASRRRIVTQIFVEMLVLCGLAAALGLVAARWGLQPINDMFDRGGRGLPFWWAPGIAPRTVLYVAGLTVLAALVAGVVPAVRATGGGLHAALRGVGSGSTAARLGSTWTGLVVTQVAFSVICLPPLLLEALEGARYAVAEAGFPAERYLSARLVPDGEPPTDAAPDEAPSPEERRGRVYGELVRRLRAEPGVSGVSFATRLPGQEQPKADVSLDLRDAEAAGTEAEVRTLSVAIDFFEVLGARLEAGRSFDARDLEPGADAVVVNRSFAEDLLGAANPVGRRLRYTSSGDTARWYRIVGMVRDLAPNPFNPGEVEARVYHPDEPAALAQPSIVVGVGPEPAAFAPRLRAITAGVEPTLRVYDVLPVDEVAALERRGLRVFYTTLGLAGASVLLLATLGVYALMSFTVAQRRREIGIRSALGADPRRLLRATFARALGQLGLGALAGVVVAALLDAVLPQGLLPLEGGVWPVLAVAGLMVAIGALSAVGPARRGLAIEPTEALRAG